MKGFLALLILAIVLKCTLCAPSSHLITSLPGLPVDIKSLGYNMYSGYININPDDNTNYFYWFIESARNPSTDPLLLWMNGGPGASSLLGLLSEHGPFRTNEEGNLDMFDYSWNKITNIIYVEAPIGVGFSYSDNKKEYITNDNKTATQNYQFLLNWFALFPEFKTNDFYITGESYGGKYCPQLAEQVLNGIQAGNTPWLNMKGLMVGNPGTDSDWWGAPNEYSFISFLYQHLLIPQDSYLKAYDTCGWSTYLTDCSGTSYTHPTTACKAAIIEAVRYMPPVDGYDVYAPKCLNDKKPKLFVNYTNWHPFSNDVIYNMGNETFYPCIDDYMTTYMNRPEVQSALHVKPTEWAYVSTRLLYRNEYENSVVPLWKRFINETNWKILVFSGDVDAAVPAINTQRWIGCLGQPVVNPWRPWVFKGQTAGIRVDYKGITFLTIKGAGHMVPYYLPQQGYAFFENWFNEIYGTQ